MKPYIDFNTQKRKEATNEADKNHFKLLNNAVYGKTMENMKKRTKIRVVKSSKDFIKYTSRSTCAIHERQILLTLNKPIYVGFTVLELSKWEMCNFHYNLMKKKFKRCTLIFTDADSLCCECDEDPYEIMYKHQELLDLSNQPKDSKYY